MTKLRALNMMNAFYHSFKNISFSRLLYRNVNVKIYKSMLLHVVLYACKTWSPILREEHRQKAFENKVPKKIFGPKRDEIIRGWRQLRNEELHNLEPSPHIIRMVKSRRMSWSEYVGRVGEKRNR
jgi:hypothetical protein